MLGHLQSALMILWIWLTAAMVACKAQRALLECKELLEGDAIGCVAKRLP